MQNRIKVTSIKVKHTPMGVWDGGYQWNIMEAPPYDAGFRGCPMGRDRDENYAIRDFVRRVNSENGLSLSPSDIEVVDFQDRSK